MSVVRATVPALRVAVVTAWEAVACQPVGFLIPLTGVLGARSLEWQL